jgi:hypothetical protein
MNRYNFRVSREPKNKEYRIVIPAVNPRKNNCGFYYNSYNEMICNFNYSLENYVFSINSNLRQGLRGLRVLLLNVAVPKGNRYD